MAKEITDDVRFFNCQVNYMIIEKMWEVFNKGKSKENLYRMLKMTKNQYSGIRKGDKQCINKLEDMWNRDNSALHIFGLSKEIMTGRKIIDTETKGIASKKSWEEYLRLRYNANEKDYLRTENMQDFTRTLRKRFSRLKVDTSGSSDIAILHYYFTHNHSIIHDLPDAEMRELYDALKKVNVKNMKYCKPDLRKAVYEELKEKYERLDTIIRYQELE